MILARKIFPPLRFGCKFSSQHVIPTKVKQLIKTVDPQSTIKIKSSLRLAVKPYDLLDCPDSNILRATLSSASGKSTADLSIEVDGSSVEIHDKDIRGKADDIFCLLEVPIKSDLDIAGFGHCVQVSDMYSDFLRLTCKQNIATKNIRSTTILLNSERGNINCNGIMLAQKMEISTAESGNVFLDKMQGDLIHCKTVNGCISTNSSYVETSIFSTEKGTLNLKNVHKKSEIHVLKEGDINMTGIHGNIYVKSNGGDMNLQFSEIYGDNIILSTSSKNVSINISDLIEESCFVELHSDKISLEDSLSHLSNLLENDNYLCMGKEQDFNNKLLVCTKGSLKFGKMSWADGVKISMGIKDL